MARAVAKSTAGEPAVVGRSAHVRGRISGQGDLRVEGTVEGDVALSGELTVAEGGEVRADVEASSVVVEGTVEGDVVAADAVALRAGAKVVGDPYDELAWGPACDVCALPVAKLMLDAGADPNWTDEAGNTPLHCIVASPLVGDPADFIAMLLEAGADPAARNAEGHTALDLARAQKTVQAYQPANAARPQKRLDRAIELLGG